MSVKYMDIGEFQKLGYLQEVNRRFLHPLGLALEIRGEEDGAGWELGGVWDYRDDPEGVVFSDPPDTEKAARIDSEWRERTGPREKALGFMVQPPGQGMPPE